jgi:hypothetical protein
MKQIPTVPRFGSSAACETLLKNHINYAKTEAVGSPKMGGGALVMWYT